MEFGNGQQHCMEVLGSNAKRFLDVDEGIMQGIMLGVNGSYNGGNCWT